MSVLFLFEFFLIYLYISSQTIYMQTINTNDLNSEYTDWVKKNGNGRNSQDLRFSQHIHNKYDFSNLYNMSNFHEDGYYIENAEKFYLCIMKQMICSEIKSLKTEKIEQNF
jgi:hypothetical protein